MIVPSGPDKIDATSTTPGGPAPEQHGIRIHLSEILTDRGMTLTQLSDRVGVGVVNLSLLKNGHAKAIRLTTHGAICAALHCQPGDLLSHHPNSP